MAVLLNRTSEVLRRARAVNAAASMLQNALERVPHPDTGALPPADLFPLTLGAFRALLGPDMTAILNFYQQPVPHQLVLQHAALAAFLGIRQ